MPIDSGPATPPPTAPTSPTSPTSTDDCIDCEKGSVGDDDDEEIIEECSEKSSQVDSPDIPSRHREKDGRPKLVQRSKSLRHTHFEKLLNMRKSMTILAGTLNSQLSSIAMTIFW